MPRFWRHQLSHGWLPAGPRSGYWGRHAPVVARVVFGPRHVRRMGQHESDRQAERRLVALPAPGPDFLEIPAGGRRHVEVLQLVGALAAAGALEALRRRVVGAGEDAQVVSRDADRVRAVLTHLRRT